MASSKVFKLHKSYKPMSSKAQLSVITIVFLIIIIGVAGYYTLNSLSIVSSGDFAKPLWARLECSPDSNNIHYQSAYLDQQSLFKCNDNTEQCDFQVTNSFYTLLAQVYVQQCDINGANCNSIQAYNGGGTKALPSIASGKSYKFSTNTGQAGYIVIKQTDTPYKLFRFYGGAKDIVNSVDCTVQSSDKALIPNNGFSGTTLQRQGGYGASWYNYVDDWAYGPATNVYTYNGQQAYCSAGKLYSIVTLQMANGQLVKLAPDYNSQTASGQTINGLGSLITAVECCPNEPNCNSNFKYIPINNNSQNNGKSCFSDVQCFNAGTPVPTDATHYVKYTCQNSLCVASSPISVTCTTNAQCPSSQICDQSLTNYGKCVQQNTGAYCGDNICQTTENFNLCPSDCAVQCPTGQTVVTQTQNTVWSIIGLTKPTTVKYCASYDFWKQWGWLIILVIAGAGLYFTRQDRRFTYGIIGVVLIYFAWSYIGGIGTTLFIIVAGIAIGAFVFRKPLFQLLRLLIAL